MIFANNKTFCIVKPEDEAFMNSLNKELEEHESAIINAEDEVKIAI